MLNGKLHGRIASAFILAAVAATASAGDVYVWKVKGSGKVSQANEVSPPIFELGFTARDKDKPFYDLTPAPGSFSPFHVALDPFENDEFTTWFVECSKGKNIRKNITVNLSRANKPVYSFEAAEAQLTGFALPGYRPGRLNNFAVAFGAQSSQLKVQGNPLYTGGREVTNPLFGVRVQMGDGSVRPTSSSPIAFDLVKGADGNPQIHVKPIRLEMQRNAAEPYRKWLQDIQKAIESGADASSLSRPLTIQYVTRKGSFTVKLGKTFVQSVVLLGDGSVRVALQTDVTGEITLESGR